MSTVIKGFFGIYLLLVFFFLSLLPAAAVMEEDSVRTSGYAYVAEIVNSHFAMPVLNRCGADAAEESYDLRVKLFFADGSQRELSYTQAGETYDLDTSGVCMSQLWVQWESEIPFLQKKREVCVAAG